MNIKKLAKKIGLSITTVSRALSGYSDVSEVTRKKVFKYAKKYKYSPNPHAARLASGKSNTLGFVIPLYLLSARYPHPPFHQYHQIHHYMELHKEYRIHPMPLQ